MAPIDCFSQEEMRQMDANDSDFIIILDSNYCHCYVSKSWFFWEGLDSKYDYLGKEFLEIPSVPYQAVGDINLRKFDSVCLRRESAYIVETHKWLHKEEWRCAVYEISPLYDNNEDFIGMMVFGRLLPNCLASCHFEVLDQLGVGRDVSQSLENPGELSDTEFNDLFMLMIGYNAKQIAFQRDVTQSAVLNSLSSARLKVHLENNEQLLEYAMDNRWYEYLPKMMRNIHSSYPLYPDSLFSKEMSLFN